MERTDCPPNSSGVIAGLCHLRLLTPLPPRVLWLQGGGARCLNPQAVWLVQPSQSRVQPNPAKSNSLRGKNCLFSIFVMFFTRKYAQFSLENQKKWQIFRLNTPPVAFKNQSSCQTQRTARLTTGPCVLMPESIFVA